MRLTLSASIAFLVGATMLMHGCASVKPTAGYERAADLARHAAGTEAVFNPDQANIAEETAALLMNDGLTVEEAVQVSLLQNPSLRAAFQEIGVATADLVQSGLFSNPTLGLSVALPEGGGRSNIQANLAQNIVDLWQIPIRKRMAAESLERTILDVAHRAVQLAGEARSAYYLAVGSAQSYAIAKENVVLARRLLEVAEVRKQVGAVGDIDVNLARGTVITSEIDVERARLDSVTALYRLAAILGQVRTPDGLDLITPLPPPPRTLLRADAVAALAFESRLDLQSANRSVAVAGARIEDEIRQVLPSFEIGAYLERNEKRAMKGRKVLADTARASVAAGGLSAPDIQSRGQRNLEKRQEIDSIVGPAFSMTLPIFDQNQAQIAKARFEYEQSLRNRDALSINVMQVVRESLARAETQWRIARSLTEELLPQAMKSLDMSRESYSSGRTALIVVLDAQRVLLEARKANVAAAQNAAMAVADLERAIARPIAEIVRAAGETVPDERTTTTQPRAGDEK